MAQPQRPGGFDMNRLSMGTKGVFIAGLVLLISLFLPWQSFGGEVEVLGQEVDIGGGSAIGFSYALGILVGILLIGLLVWEGLLAGGVNINMGTTSPALISAIAGGVIALLALIFFLTSLGNISWGAFIGLLATLGLGYASYVRFQESKTTAPPPPMA